MFVRKERAGAASTGHEWVGDGAVVEVPDAVGGELLEHDPAEFTDVTEAELAKKAKAAEAEKEPAKKAAPTAKKAE